MFLTLERIQIRASRRALQTAAVKYGSAAAARRGARRYCGARRHVDVWSSRVVYVIIKGYYGQHKLDDAAAPPAGWCACG